MNKIKDLICSIKMLNEGQIFIKGGGDKGGMQLKHVLFSRLYKTNIRSDTFL